MKLNHPPAASDLPSETLSRRNSNIFAAADDGEGENGINDDGDGDRAMNSRAPRILQMHARFETHM